MYLIGMLVLALNLSPAHAGKVTMFTDETRTTKIKREKLDCKIHKNKKSSLTLGFKMNVAFAAKVGPEVTFGRDTGIQWNGMSQELIRRYEELCDAHNKGHLTVAEYDRRYEKLDGYFERAADLKQQIEENVFQRADKAFDDLDAEAAKYNSDGTPKADIKTEMKAKIKKYSSDIASLADEVQAEDEGGPEGKAKSKPEPKRPVKAQPKSEDSSEGN